MIWALGVENRDDPHVVAGLQVAKDDLTSLTGGCRAPVLRIDSDKAKEFLAKSVRSLLKAHGIRQTTNSGYDPAANGIAERGLALLRAGRRRCWPNIVCHWTIGRMLVDGWRVYTIIGCWALGSMRRIRCLEMWWSCIDS